MPTFIFDENFIEKPIFIFVALGFVGGLCFSLLEDIWEGVKELVGAVWDSAREAFKGYDIADLEGEGFLERIAKALKKVVGFLNWLRVSKFWFFHIAPSLLLGLGGLVRPIYKLVREMLNLAEWPSFIGFDFRQVFLELLNQTVNNLPFFVAGALQYLRLIYLVLGILLLTLESCFFFTLLTIRFKNRFFAKKNPSSSNLVPTFFCVLIK